MKCLRLSGCVYLATAFFVCGIGSIANGQNRGNVTVQLPTFHQFGVSTTVVVPDQGTRYLGGVNSSSRGSSQFGPGLPGLANRGLGRSSVSSGMSISATIIDHHEIDRALLAEATRRRGDLVDIRGRPIADAPKAPLATATHYAAARARDGRNSLAPPRFRRTPRSYDDAESGRVETYWQRAQRAEADGQPHQAKIFYRRVVKHGSATRKQQAEAELVRLEAVITK